MTFMRSQLKKEKFNCFLPYRDLNHGPLEPKASVLPMSYLQFFLQRCKVNTVGWSHPNPDQVISGDDFGTIVIWDVTVNATRFVTFGRQSIYVLETHPFNGDIVGFGCRLGLVFVADVSGSSNFSHFEIIPK